MPITRELTDDELQKLDEQGIDSSQYKGKQVPIYTDDEVAAQSTQPTAQEDKKPISTLGTIAATAKAHAGGYLGGGVGALGTTALLAPWLAGPEAGIPADIAMMVAAGVGGAGGGYLGQKGQETVEGSDEAAKLEQAAQEAASQHPIVSAATDITGSALAGGGKLSLSNLPKALLGNKVALGKIAAASLLNPAINTGINYAATGQLPTNKELLEQAAGGALFSEGADWAGKITGHGNEPTGEPIETPSTVDTISEQNTGKDPNATQTQQPQVALPSQQGPPVPEREPGARLTLQQYLDDSLRDASDLQNAAKKSDYAKMQAEKVSQDNPTPTQGPPNPVNKPLTDNQIKITNPSLTEAMESNGISRPNTPQTDEEGAPVKYAPSTDQPSDRDAYEQKYQQLSQMMKDGKAGTPEFQQTWKEMEDIKNQNKGMPPAPSETSETPNTKEAPPTEPISFSQKLGEHIEDTKATVGSVLQQMAGSDNAYKDLASHLLGSVSPDKLQAPITASHNTERSNYNLSNKSIDLSAQNADHFKPNVVMHEIGHAVTSNSLPKQFDGLRGETLKTTMDSYLKDPKADPAVKELINSYYETAKNLGLHDALFKDKEVTNKSGLKGYKTGAAGIPDRAKLTGEHGYSLGDLHEFVTSVFSDKAFQKKLNEMPSGLNDNRSMWSRIVDSIKRVMGLDVKSGSLLERALKAGGEISEKPNTEDYSTGNKEVKKEAPVPAGQSPEENTKRMGGFGKIFKSSIDTVKDLAHPQAKEVASALQKAHQEKDERFGKTFNKLQETADKLGLTKQDQEQLKKISEYENLNGQKAPSTMFRNSRQVKMYQAERTVYDESGKFRIANGEPVYRGGNPTQLKQDPFSHPLTPNQDVINTYRQNNDKAAIAKLDKTFLDYQTKKAGLTMSEAQEKLNTFKDAIQGGGTNSDSSNLQFYNAARRAQGITLPPEFSKQGYMQNLETYYSRQALDNSFYKNVESNPKVMSALGAEKDAWGNPIPKNPEGSIGNNDAVKAALKEFQGSPSSLANRTEGAVSSLATSLFISNPAIELHKLGSNIIGIAGMADNPIQAAKTFGKMISNFTSGLTHATENGVHKLTARDAMDMFDSTASVSQRMQSLARGVRQISSLGDLTTKFSDGLMQAGAEYTLPNKITKANNGDETSQQLLKKIDPDYVVGKTYNPQEISKLASSLTGFLHGTHDGRTMPSWMAGDSELAGFFKLAHWSVAQTNKFMSDIYTPATKGDYKPLLNGVFGAAIGGYLIKELREKVQGKHGQIPDLGEIASSTKGLSGNKGLVAYNAIAAAQYAGFGGLLSQIAKYPFDVAYKNNPQGATFPLDEISTDLVKTLGQVSSAIANDPHPDWFELAKQVTAHIMTTDVQLARVGYNAAINSGLVDGSLAEKKQLSDKLGQLRRFNMVEGYPYEDSDPSSSNPYMNLEQKGFKRTQDIGEAASKLPNLVNNILIQYQDHPDVMMEKLKALKENNYETFPSMESTPIKFGSYLSYLTKKDGPQAAQDELMDYLQHRAINSAKAKMVP